MQDLNSPCNLPDGGAADAGAPGVQHCGHIFVSSAVGGNAIYEVDPTAPPPGNTTLFASIVNTDGIAWNVNGTVLYAINRTNGNGTGTILEFDPQGNSLTANPIPQFGAGLDGIAVGYGNLDGCIYVNDNGGTVWEIKLAGTTQCSFNVPTSVQINPIATGGSRGDLIAVDPSFRSGGMPFLPDGGVNLRGTYASLLITQSDSIYRIDPPGGGFFGPPNSAAAPVAAAAITSAHPVPAFGGGALAATSLLLLVVGTISVRARRLKTMASWHGKA